MFTYWNRSLRRIFRKNGYPTNPEGYGNQNDHNRRYLKLQSDLLFEGRFKLIRSTSDLTLPLLPKNTFSTIYIDGAHFYTQVKKDILNSIDLITHDGVILIDDYLIGPTKPGFGVNQAIKEVVSEKILIPVAASDDKRFKKIILAKNEDTKILFQNKLETQAKQEKGLNF